MTVDEPPLEILSGAKLDSSEPLVNPRLKEYLDKPVEELVRLDEPPLPEGQKERHRIFSLMLMALVHHYWNGNKKGRKGRYPHNEDVSAPDGPYLDGDYRGHNIAGVCVDGSGHIIDFDFNHNSVFNSSVEHAEARVVRRVYNLTQIHDTWNINLEPGQAIPRDHYNTLENVTVYTSLESCAQCAGIMALGRVKEVVYLQSDPGMYLIGNILRNLTKDTKLAAPVPIAARQCGLPFFDRLNEAYCEFHNTIARPEVPPFHVAEDGEEDRSQSVTSFLCTKMARAIFRDGAGAFGRLSDGTAELEHRDFCPGGTPKPGMMTNAQCLEEAKNFLDYARTRGRRGTPHH